MTHIECDHLACTTLQKAISEATCRGSGVERSKASDIETEVSERAFQLLTTATDEAGRWSGNDKRVSGCNLARRLRRN